MHIILYIYIIFYRATTAINNSDQNNIKKNWTKKHMEHLFGCLLRKIMPWNAVEYIARTTGINKTLLLTRTDYCKWYMNQKYTEGTNYVQKSLYKCPSVSDGIGDSSALRWTYL